MAGLIVEAVVVGFLVLVGGTVVSKLLASSFSVKLPPACKHWNKHHLMEISLFLTGFLVHLFCELIGFNKWYCKQGTAMKSIKQQDNKNIIGIMMESNIYEGKQNSENKPLKYGISITDSCVGIINTKKYLLEFAE